MDGSNPPHLSPTFFRDGETPTSREVKCVAPIADFDDIAAWLSERLAVDPHGAKERGGDYTIHTTCLDTPALDIFHLDGDDACTKHRLRRYGAEPWVHLERKVKSDGWVTKDRTRLPIASSDGLWSAEGDVAADARWFRDGLAAGNLVPVRHMTYVRRAWFTDDATPFRITVDRGLEAAAADPIAPGPRPGTPFLAESAIVEVKFRNALPRIFKELLENWSLAPVRISKYRRAMRALPASNDT